MGAAPNSPPHKYITGAPRATRETWRSNELLLRWTLSLFIFFSMIIESCPLTAASMFIYRPRTAKRRSKRSQWLLSVNGLMVKGIIHFVRNFYCHAWHLRHRNEQPTTGQSLLLSRYTIRRREKLIFRIVVMRPPAVRTVVCTPVVSVKHTLGAVFISSVYGIP